MPTSEMIARTYVSLRKAGYSPAETRDLLNSARTLQQTGNAAGWEVTWEEAVSMAKTKRTAEKRG